MKKTVYKTIAYQKGVTGRKGPVKMTKTFNCITEAVKVLQNWVWLHEDLYYYSIEREIIIENE